jgi:hypothetical protein
MRKPSMTLILKLLGLLMLANGLLFTAGPSAQAKVKPKPEVMVPDVRGYLKGLGEYMLESAGFRTAVSSKPVSGDGAPIGDIAGTLPAGNTKAAFGSVVTLMIAGGPSGCPTCVPGYGGVVPNLIGLSLVEAESLLTGHLKLGNVTPVGATSGVVRSTDPNPDYAFSSPTPFYPPIPVNLTIKEGPEVDALTPASASAGATVTVTGSDFGAAQGSGFVWLRDNGFSWGCGPCGNLPRLTIDSWSNDAITFTVPRPSGPKHAVGVYPGSWATLTVANSDTASNTLPLQIRPTANLGDYYNNTGISDERNQGCANMDGLGYSYSAAALAGAHLTPGATVSTGGLTYVWPNAPSCQADNILAAGQTIIVTGFPGATALGLMGASTCGSSQGTIVVNYTDGTSSTAEVSFNDWAHDAGSDDTVVATMPYRHRTNGTTEDLLMYVYSASVPVDPSRTVASITLPDVSTTVSGGTTAMHIYALSLGT